MDTDRRVFEHITVNDGYLIRLVPGDDFYAATTTLLRAHEVERGAFLSAIGSLCNVSYRNVEAGADLPISSEKTVLGEASGPFELLSLEGTFVPMDGELRYNVHVMLGEADGSVIGGHLFQAEVFTTLEMVIVALGGSRAIKEVSSVTGLPELNV
jgi:hypothetical protein